MDLYCPKMGCGEPVDNDYLHDIAADENKTYKEILRDFQRRGCEALGDTHNESGSDVGVYADALYDLLGDDVDSIQGMLEDFGIV